MHSRLYTTILIFLSLFNVVHAQYDFGYGEMNLYPYTNFKYDGYVRGGYMIIDTSFLNLPEPNLFLHNSIIGTPTAAWLNIESTTWAMIINSDNIQPILDDLAPSFVIEGSGIADVVSYETGWVVHVDPPEISPTPTPFDVEGSGAATVIQSSTGWNVRVPTPAPTPQVTGEGALDVISYSTGYHIINTINDELGGRYQTTILNPTTEVTINHGLGYQDVLVGIRGTVDNRAIVPNLIMNTTDTLTLEFGIDLEFPIEVLVIAGGYGNGGDGGTMDHGELYGLTDYDHTWAVHKTIAGTITAVHTFDPTTATAPFILGENAQSQKVIGLNSDEWDGYKDFEVIGHGRKTTDGDNSLIVEIYTPVPTFTPTNTPTLTPTPTPFDVEGSGAATVVQSSTGWNVNVPTPVPHPSKDTYIIGNGSSTSFTWNTEDSGYYPIVGVRESGPPYRKVYCGIVVGYNTITFNFTVPPKQGEFQAAYIPFDVSAENNTINHGLGSKDLAHAVYDSENRYVIVDATATTDNQLITTSYHAGDKLVVADLSERSIIGDGSSQEFTIEHDKRSREGFIQTIRDSSGKFIVSGGAFTELDSIDVHFGDVPTTNEYVVAYEFLETRDIDLDKIYRRIDHSNFPTPTPFEITGVGIDVIQGSTGWDIIHYTPTPTATDTPTPTMLVIQEGPGIEVGINDDGYIISAHTPTITPTATRTPTATVTPTNTATETPIPTDTPRPTETPFDIEGGYGIEVEQDSNSWTINAHTPTVTPTATVTPTNTATPTFTPTFTPPPTPRPEVTITGTGALYPTRVATNNYNLVVPTPRPEVTIVGSGAINITRNSVNNYTLVVPTPVNTATEKPNPTPQPTVKITTSGIATMTPIVGGYNIHVPVQPTPRPEVTILAGSYIEVTKNSTNNFTISAFTPTVTPTATVTPTNTPTATFTPTFTPPPTPRPEVTITGTGALYPTRVATNNYNLVVPTPRPQVSITTTGAISATPVSVNNYNLVVPTPITYTASAPILFTGSDISLLYNSTTLSIVENRLKANNDSPIWNANKIYGNMVSSAVPLEGYILVYRSGIWTPETFTHNHNDIYYTETEVNNLLNNKTSKVNPSTTNNFVSFLDTTGNLKDSGYDYSDFAPLIHNHDPYYISIISTPNVGNFPIMTSGGELETSAYGPGSFSSSTHNHNHDDLLNIDVNQHRTMNDATTSTTTLWSSSKIDTELSKYIELDGSNWGLSPSGTVHGDTVLDSIWRNMVLYNDFKMSKASEIFDMYISGNDLIMDASNVNVEIRGDDKIYMSDNTTKNITFDVNDGSIDTNIGIFDYIQFKRDYTETEADSLPNGSVFILDDTEIIGFGFKNEDVLEMGRMYTMTEIVSSVTLSDTSRYAYLGVNYDYDGNGTKETKYLAFFKQ